MAGRNRPNMAGLLKLKVFVLLFFIAFPLTAQDTSLGINTETYPDNPQAGQTWTLTIMVDHPNTQDVIVQAPRLPESIQLERVRSGTWFLGHAVPGSEEDVGSSVWTYIEYLFYLRQAGNFTLEPFSVSVGSRSAATSRFLLRVADMTDTAARPLPYLRWENTFSFFISGIESEIILALHNWDNAKPQPRSIFQGRVLERFIMEEQPSIYSTTDAVIRYPIRIIPLDTLDFSFGPLRTYIEGETLEIPSLFIPVLENSGAVRIIDNVSASKDEALHEALLLDAYVHERDHIPFIQSSQDVFPLFRKAYGNITVKAQDLWEQGLHAQALALVRSKERDTAFGPSFILLRRTMEQAIGLSDTKDENWSFPYYLSFIIGGLFFVLLFCRMLYRSFRHNNRAVPDESLVTFYPLKGFIHIIIKIITAGIGAVLIYAGLAGFFGNKEAGRSAVLTYTDAFRVPDSAGAISSQFEEGQAVRILSSASSWSFVESADGRSGWVEAEAIIVY